MIRAPVCLLRGFGHLAKHRELWTCALLAFAVNVVVFTAAAIAFVVLLDDLASLSPDGAGAVGEFILGILAVAAAGALLLFGYTLVGNAVAGPFLDAMTSRMLADLGEPPPKPRSLLASIVLPILRQAQKLAMFGGLQLAALLLWIVPGIGAIAHSIAAVGLLLYFLGAEYVDYPLDARGFGVPARLRWSLRHFGATLGFGASVALLSFVPLLGYFCLPASVAGATLMVHEIDRINA